MEGGSDPTNGITQPVMLSERFVDFLHFAFKKSKKYIGADPMKRRFCVSESDCFFVVGKEKEIWLGFSHVRMIEPRHLISK
jgi:hypothetical protein